MSADHARSRALRQGLALCRLLATEALTLQGIGRRLRCDQRTARRYVYALQLAGVDVVDEWRLSAKVYRLDRRAWLGLLDLPADSRPKGEDHGTA